MNRTTATSPRAARWLLERWLPPAEREFVLGDLEEMFAAQLAAGMPMPAARRAYWRAALSSIASLRSGRVARAAEARGQAPLKSRDASVEDTRAVWSRAGFSQAAGDIRYVLRTLSRSPGFAATVILTLALGIGATTAIFSVADATLFRPVLYPDPERLVRVRLAPDDPSQEFIGIDDRRLFQPSSWDFKNWQTLSRSFEAIATETGASASLVEEPPEVEPLPARAVSADYFRVYGIWPFVGRGFSSQDQQAGAPPVVILGYNFWRERLGGDRAVLGTPIRFEEGEATIVGILPPSLAPTIPVWRPIALSAMDSRSTLPFVARLATGVSLSEAQAELTAITPRETPMRPRSGVARPFVTPEVRPPEGRTAWILLGAVACVLLIACVNVAGLQFARGVSRQQELIVRSALGAGRWRLVRLVLTESLVLAGVGGLVGVALAWLTLDALLAILPLELSLRPATLNPVVLTGAALISIASGVAFGLVPAIRLSAVRFGAQSLRLGSGPRLTTAGRRASRMLMAAQVALAFVLLVASSLMIRTLLQVHAVDLGFEPERFVAVDASVRDRARMEAFYAALLDRVRGVPGVTAVGAVAGLPLGGLAITSGGFLRYPDGRPTSEPESGWDNRSFVPGYFETIGMRRVAGHWPSPAECAATPRPLVLSESAARRLFGPDPAVGQLLIASNESHRVAAVAADIRHRGPQEDPVFEIYFCRDDPVALIRASLTIVVRSDRQPSDLALPLRSAVLGIGERVSNIRIRSGSDLFSGVTAVPRHRTQLLSLLGGLGLVLAMVGVFGLTAYAVARRTREIGIRMAFGARRVDAVMVMIRDAAVAGAIGLALGLLVAFLGAPVLGAFLFQVPPRDPVAFGSAALVLACAGLVAAWIPARRAARVNPVEALRAE